eukprot:gnl/MRDRNA2_/MRDRNA2_178398_c0_seq1.p2 gnl/MRDRNA2_/MRDRNA2_178398_c0~~gnl/MRDRNA2_/MRDRNA2_178398_c0_seq1.p2  ORF type:complete len:120 (+),score=6.12 gnl/MRDRNA2_/MRDRNA2_178398_c0_seq1:308-667(+)
MQIFIATKPCLGVYATLFVCYLCENGLNIYILYHWWIGSSLVLEAKTEEVKECEYLHDVAWWLWVAVPLFILPVMLLTICALVSSLFASAPAAKAREIPEGQGLVVTPSIEEVCYEKLP